MHYILLAGVVWLFLGAQSEGHVSRLNCSDGLANPLDVKVFFNLHM